MSKLSKPTFPETPAGTVVCLEARGVTAGYGGSPIIRGINLIVPAGKIVAIIGPNGAGKSTFLKAICGFNRMSEGTVNFFGTPIQQLSADRIAVAGIGFVPQGRNVFPSLTVAENLDMGAFLHTKQRAARTEEVLHLFPGLKDKLKRRAGVLSGGERTMLAIGRALMAGPRLLLLDEPSSGLAPAAVKQLWQHLRQLQDMGTTLLIVEQRTREVLSVSDWAYVLVNGKNAVDSDASELLARGDLGKVFLQAGREAASGT